MFLQSNYTGDFSAWSSNASIQLKYDNCSILIVLLSNCVLVRQVQISFVQRWIRDETTPYFQGIHNIRGLKETTPAMATGTTQANFSYSYVELNTAVT